jgi:hypothetical protein
VAWGDGLNGRGLFSDDHQLHNISTETALRYHAANRKPDRPTVGFSRFGQFKTLDEP